MTELSLFHKSIDLHWSHQAIQRFLSWLSDRADVRASETFLRMRTTPGRFEFRNEKLAVLLLYIAPWLCLYRTPWIFNGELCG